LRNPAHYSGVYGHKPTWGLISTRGHAPPGIVTLTELPPPRRARLSEFRVAVWASSPLCRIGTSVSDLFNRAIDAVVRAGATVDDDGGVPRHLSWVALLPGEILRSTCRGQRLGKRAAICGLKTSWRQGAMAVPIFIAAMSRRAPPRRGHSDRPR
jgi:Asp-tRNA(Asn)/Glu-tRNA(Gln) amidotransferase A subunit family amidase